MRMRMVGTSLVAALALCASACGGGGDDGGSGGDGPIKIVGLWEVKGESANAINDYNNAAKMAVAKINAAGGIAGRKLDFERVPADPVNPQKATSQFLQAVDKEPAMLIGFTASSALLASKGQVDRAGIPLIATASASEPMRLGAKGGSEWAWYVQPSDEYKDKATLRYALEGLKAKKIGLTGTNESYGQTNIKMLTEMLAAKGMKPYATHTHDVKATDLTKGVLTMKGADAVISFTYPNPLSIQLKQFVQNGMDIPIISASSAAIAAYNKLVTGKSLDLLYGTSACDAVGSKNPATRKFGKEYKKKYGQNPTDLAAETYDAFWIAKAAIEKAGSTDPEAIQKAMNAITVNKNVICAKEYKSDGAHFMNHTMSIMKFNRDGTSKELKTYSFPPTPAAKG